MGAEAYNIIYISCTSYTVYTNSNILTRPGLAATLRLLLPQLCRDHSVPYRDHSVPRVRPLARERPSLRLLPVVLVVVVVEEQLYNKTDEKGKGERINRIRGTR